MFFNIIMLVICILTLLIFVALNIVTSKPNSQLTKFLDKVIFYFHASERERLKKIKERDDVYNNGSSEDIIKYNNIKSPDYQMMLDGEVYLKYDGIPKDKIVIVDVPMFIYNTKEKKIIKDNKEMMEIINGNQLVYKKDNVSKIVDTHQDLPTINLLVNDNDKFVIFRHKTEYYRYKILEII